MHFTEFHKYHSCYRKSQGSNSINARRRLQSNGTFTELQITQKTSGIIDQSSPPMLMHCIKTLDYYDIDIIADDPRIADYNFFAMDITFPVHVEV